MAKYGGFTKASKKLFVQQPAISKTVATLEEDLGVKLFDREKRSVNLTDIGAEIFSKCDEIFKKVDEINLIAAEGKYECSGPMRFCASEPVSSYFVPTVYNEFLATFPEVIPTCFSGFASDLMTKIEEGEFEFGLFFHTPKTSAKLKVEKIAQIPFDVVIKASEKNNLDIIRSFIGSREIDDVSTKDFPTINKMNKDFKKVKIRISSNSLTSHKNMVLSGLGVSVLPEVMVREEIKRKDLVRLYPRGTFNFSLKLVSKKNHFLSRNATAWINCFKEYY